MEIKDNPALLFDETHPNFLRWQRARQLSLERGKFVQSILNNYLNKNNLDILDLGSGEGGTAKVFSENNSVICLDLSLLRLKRQLTNIISRQPALPAGKLSRMTNPILINGNALQLPFANNSFDLIILQDVIEHLLVINNFYSEIKRVLGNNGIIYLSTPNKLSIFNFLSDPHFGMPIISLLNRKSIKKYFLKYFRKDDFKRADIAQLLSLNEILNLFEKDFQIFLNTKFAVKALFNGNRGIIWSDFHLSLIKWCKKLKLNSLLLKITNDKFGLLNKFLTPTFYMVLKRKL